MKIITKSKSFIRMNLNRLGFKIIKVSNQPHLVKSKNQHTLYQSLYDQEVLNRKPFYNVGAGSFSHPYWTNIDFISDWYKNIQKNILHYDLMSLLPLPIETETAKIIYTSHTIEHIKEHAAANFFREAYRALELGGIFRITTGPDAETDYRALQNNDVDWFYWDTAYEKPGTYEHIYNTSPTKASLAERWLHHVATPLSHFDKSPSTIKFSEKEILEILAERGLEKALDYFCSLCPYDPSRPGNHISWWTHEKIFSYLKDAGFKTIYRSGYSQSVSPLLRQSGFFDSTHPQMSIYVEAIKD